MTNEKVARALLPLDRRIARAEMNVAAAERAAEAAWLAVARAREQLSALLTARELVIHGLDDAYPEEGSHA